MGGGGTIIIVGDKDIATQVKDHIGKVASFRQSRALAIIASYESNENSIDRAQQLFLLRCAADILDNQ